MNGVNGRKKEEKGMRDEAKKETEVDELKKKVRD
jgi:hypothetical protein